MLLQVDRRAHRAMVVQSQAVQPSFAELLEPGQRVKYTTQPQCTPLNVVYSVIIVDSTRRGKSFPDALSKTIPIWCAVVNRVVSSLHGKAWNAECLDTAMPLASVGPSEANQIQQLLPAWTKRLLVRRSMHSDRLR